MDETGFRYNNLFADDIHGFGDIVASLGRGSGFANVTFVQPHVTFYPRKEKNLVIDFSFTFHRATRARMEGTGVLGALPRASNRLTSNIGSEFDLNVEYLHKENVRPFIRFGGFWPGNIFGPQAARAIKLEGGIEFRF
jgi:Alginate export